VWAAGASGLDIAEATIVHDADGRAGLLVRRCDRVTAADGSSAALAQEDGCQVLGRYPADKYNLESESVARGLVAVTRAQPVAARQLLAQFVFAYLTGNGDAHAKNFSVGRTPDGEWRLTPAYDVVSTHPYGDHTLALGVNGKRGEDLGRVDFLAFAEAVGLRERAATRTITDLVDRTERWLPRLGELPFDGHRIHRLVRAVEDRRRRLRQ